MIDWETGAKGDKVAGAVGNTYMKGGVERIGYQLKPWEAYGMPTPTCDDDGWSPDSHVIASQRCGSQSKGGRRWGQCDQWRSSCDKRFTSYLNIAGGLVDAVKTAANATASSKAHVTPCMFGELYSQAMYYINQCVGSYDPVTGLYTPEPDSPAYVPRWASWIFGGDAGLSNFPQFADEWNRDTPGATAWWDGGVDEYVGTWQSRVGDGEFCRQVITASYPCLGATSYPGKCGGCAKTSLLGCSNYTCSHYPLEYYQRKFSELRMELLNSVLIYEGKNKSILNGLTIDEACADQIVKAVVAAPPIDPEAVDANQGAYQAAIQKEEDEAAAAALLNQALFGDQEEAGGLPIGLIIGGIAAVGAAIWLGTRR